MNRGQCYSFNTLTLTWSDARELCKNVGVGYDLVVINDEVENQFVANVIENEFGDGKTFWIGLKLEETKKIFEWVDDSELNYQYWGENNPNLVRPIHIIMLTT